ncbi:MAG TPA: DUF503 domain-containing protein [Bryobacteraceae bacterium]|jgi:hypothetical protein
MTMHIGTLTVVLYLHAAESLKDKRQVVKSLIETTRHKFNISIAEIDDLDKWRKATIGIAFVSNDKAYVNRVLDKVVNTLESNPAVEVGEVELELL